MYSFFESTGWICLISAVECVRGSFTYWTSVRRRRTGWPVSSASSRSPARSRGDRRRRPRPGCRAGGFMMALIMLQPGHGARRDDPRGDGMRDISLPGLANRCWKVLEPLHGVTYFMPETLEEAKAAGLKGFWMAYFGFRAAPLGPVPAAVVQATFFNFHRSRV